MREYLFEAREELKRADHLIYVSLKYTRTVDVIRAVIERLINAFDQAINCLLEKAREEKKIDSYPKSAGARCNIVKQIFLDDKRMQEYIDFYLLLRKLMRSEYKRIEEYRRHVAMLVQIDSDTLIRVDIDKVREYYDRTEGFVNMVSEHCGGSEEDFENYYF